MKYLYCQPKLTKYKRDVYYQSIIYLSANLTTNNKGC